jgi:hypothetical protein
MTGLVVEQVHWTGSVSKKLSRAAGEDLHAIRKEVDGGISRLWWCHSKTTRGYIVTRLEKVHDKDVLVLVLGEGRGFGEVVEYLLSTVKKRKLSFRVHVRNKALVKMFEKHGLSVNEYVLVNHGW